MKLRTKIYSCALAISLGIGLTNAQEETTVGGADLDVQQRTWTDNLYIGGGLGANFGFTDIKQYVWYPVRNYSSEYSMGFNAFAGYTVSSIFSIEAGGFLGSARGVSRSRGLWHKSDIRELTLGTKVDLTNLFFSGSSKPKKFAIFTEVGLGYAFYRGTLRRLVAENQSEALVVRTVDKNGITTTSNDELDGFSGALTFYGGAGISYKAAKNIEVFAKVRATYMNTDKLDAWESTNNTQDKYVFTSVGVTYNFGNKKWIRPEEEFVDKLSMLDSIMDGFKDTDGDGVIDLVDKDSSTPSGAKVYGDGTAVDTDGDGIPDHLDQEVLSPCNKVDERGVAIDSDGDGVPDCKDLEPNTTKGALVDIHGRAINVSGGSGESRVSGTAPAFIPSIFFELNSRSVSPSNYASLTQLAQYLTLNPNAKVQVIGHADATGSDAVNQTVGKQRAEAVVAYMNKVYGIDASKFEVISKGASEPLAKGTRARENRRVDFIIK